jgi:hypothetical protein
MNGLSQQLGQNPARKIKAMQTKRKNYYHKDFYCKKISPSLASDLILIFLSQHIEEHHFNNANKIPVVVI